MAMEVLEQVTIHAWNRECYFPMLQFKVGVVQVCPAMHAKGGQLLKVCGTDSSHSGLSDVRTQKHLNTRADLKEAEQRVSASDADVTGAQSICLSRVCFMAGCLVNHGRIRCVMAGTSLESYCGTLLEEYEEELKATRLGS